MTFTVDHWCISRDSTFAEHIRRKGAAKATLVPGDLSLCQAAVAKAFDPQHCINRCLALLANKKQRISCSMNIVPARYVQPKENICLDPGTIPPPTNQTYFAFSTYWYIWIYLFYLYMNSTYSLIDLVPILSGISLPACAWTGGLWAPLLHSRRPSIRTQKRVGWNSGINILSTLRYDESLTAICNSTLPKLRKDPKEDGWGLRDTVYVACFQVYNLTIWCTNCITFYCLGKLFGSLADQRLPFLSKAVVQHHSCEAAWAAPSRGLILKHFVGFEYAMGMVIISCM